MGDTGKVEQIVAREVTSKMTPLEDSVRRIKYGWPIITAVIIFLVFLYTNFAPANVVDRISAKQDAQSALSALHELQHEKEISEVKESQAKLGAQLVDVKSEFHYQRELFDRQQRQLEEIARTIHAKIVTQLFEDDAPPARRSPR